MKIERKLQDYIDRFGLDRVLAALEGLESQASTEAESMTIISNKGVHHFPDFLRRGHVYVASEGNMDFSSIQIVREQYEEILSQLAKELKSRPWKRIYLVPFGHSTLSMQIKLLVYRVTRLETIDVFYDGHGNYNDLKLDLRNIIVHAPEP